MDIDIKSIYSQVNSPEKQFLIKKYVKETDFLFTRHALKNYFLRSLNCFFDKQNFRRLNDLVSFLKDSLSDKNNYVSLLSDYLNTYIHKKGVITSLSSKAQEYYQNRDSRNGRRESLKLRVGSFIFIVDYEDKSVITTELNIFNDYDKSSELNRMNGLNPELIKFLEENDKGEFLDNIKEFLNISEDTKSHHNNPNLRFSEIDVPQFTSKMLSLKEQSIPYTDTQINSDHYCFLFDHGDPSGMITCSLNNLHNIVYIDVLFANETKKGYESYIIEEFEKKIKNQFTDAPISIIISLCKELEERLKSEYFFVRHGYTNTVINEKTVFQKTL
jgi:hypothetical protein